MTTNEALNDFIRQCQQRVERSLERLLPNTTTLPTRLHEAMRYATLNGGKRIRPLLVYAAGQALGISRERLDTPACAIELIHAYSLVHDDLPAMDDDDLRRNRPTCHRAYDEATAILVGDALQTLAFQSLCCDQHMQADAGTRLAMVETLARASGSRGMAGGQAIDLEAVGKELNLAELENLHIHKTGALIRAAVRFSTQLSATAEKSLTTRLDRYAKCIGLAFQIRDDVLDVEGDTETLGKTQGKDIAQEKPTYPSLLGLHGAKEKADELLQEALQSLEDFNTEADPLRWIAQYITARKH
ncbi:MAG: (2E,6E)-farnesyl diphosphate synthase [Candidatus Thiodiazotropha sp. (ex Dulcina madagascariensis)]|nr:(2E,6E)-farnesyl diphosphate synthase [Candidatus Thiodiazotropha sp. (ex Dulcina madagascariensis)]